MHCCYLPLLHVAFSRPTFLPPPESHTIVMVHILVYATHSTWLIEFLLPSVIISLIFYETSLLWSLYEILFGHITFEIFSQVLEGIDLPFVFFCCLSSFVSIQENWHGQTAEWCNFCMNAKFWKAPNLTEPYLNKTWLFFSVFNVLISSIICIL